MNNSTVLAYTGRAEWRRIWSVRSSWAFTAMTAITVLGIAAIVGYDTANDPSGPPPDGTAWDGGRITAMFALFGILAMSVVTTTADYGTGGIVPTLQWTPRRSVLLTARASIITATTAALAVLLVASASVVVWLFVPEAGLPMDQGVKTLAALGFLYIAAAVLAVGLGLTLRSTAGALVTVFALVLVLPMLLAQLPYEWAVNLAALMPGSGALYLIFGEGPHDDMTTTSARVTLATWAVGAVLIGGWRLLRTDANC